MRRVLLVEDNPDLAFGLRTSLEVEGYEVLHAETGTAGVTMAHDGTPDLMVLDLMLPELTGYEVLRRVRRGGGTMPVLILTARGEEADKVQGFRLGADDYVVKPVGVLEFLARVEALLRRTQPRSRVGPVRVGQTRDRQRTPLGERGRRRDRPQSPRVRPADDAGAAAGLAGHSRRAAQGGMGVSVGRRVAHGGHPHRQAPRQDRSRGPSCIVTVRKQGYRLR